MSVKVASGVPAAIAAPSTPTTALATGKSGDWTMTAVLVTLAVLLEGSATARPLPLSTIETATGKPAKFSLV